MTDIEIIKKFGGYDKFLNVFPHSIQPSYQLVHKWGSRGFPAAMRPTIWALIETHLPDLAIKLDRDVFLGVRIVTPTEAA